MAADQTSRLHDWLSLPLLRHGHASAVSIRVEYQEGGRVPGSAAVEFHADTDDNRHFQVLRIGRYDIPQLVLTLEGLGWRCLSRLPYGDQEGYPRVLLLLQKGDQP